jgi:hypothetical protein
VGIVCPTLPPAATHDNHLLHREIEDREIEEGRNNSAISTSRWLGDQGLDEITLGQRLRKLVVFRPSLISNAFLLVSLSKMSRSKPSTLRILPRGISIKANDYTSK